MLTDLDTIRQHINAGAVEEAKRALATLLRTDSKNVDAWILLATLFDDPSRQADCFKQVLKIDPGNHHAAARLRTLAGQPPESASKGAPSSKEEPVLRCPQCGGAMEVRFIGEMRDKRAACLYCNTHVDLPDSFRRVRKKSTRERRFGGSRASEEIVIETRSDGQISIEDPESLPSEVQEMLQILKEKGAAGLDEKFLRSLQARGINVAFDPDDLAPGALQLLKDHGYDIYDDSPLKDSSRTVLIKSEEWDAGFLGPLLFEMGATEGKPALLTTEKIVELAGGALPQDQRRECPNSACRAVIPKDATRCSWCGELL